MTPMAQHLFGTAQPVAIRQVFADWGVPRHDEIQRHRQSRPLLRTLNLAYEIASVPTYGNLADEM